MERLRLELIGITYNQIESGVYAVILQELDGVRRMPIIIGYAEAQSIECKLNQIVTPRPLTHDLMVRMLECSGLSIQEVEIKRDRSGVFTADILLSDGISEHIIDARSSDALALAIRVGAPIYTSRQLMDYAGVDPSGKRSSAPNNQMWSSSESAPAVKSTPSRVNIDDLKQAMQKAAEMENYEEASRIKTIIDRLIERSENQDDAVD